MRGSGHAEPEVKVAEAAVAEAEAVLESTASGFLVQTSICRSVCWFVRRLSVNLYIAFQKTLES